MVPVLEPEEVAKKTVNAILTNEKICIIPGFLSMAQTMKTSVSLFGIFSSTNW